MKKLFFVPILTLLFLAVTVLANAGWVTTRLTNNTTRDYFPQINASGHVVWYGQGGRDYEIFYYDGNTITQLTDNTVYDKSPPLSQYLPYPKNPAPQFTL